MYELLLTRNRSFKIWVLRSENLARLRLGYIFQLTLPFLVKEVFGFGILPEVFL